MAGGSSSTGTKKPANSNGKYFGRGPEAEKEAFDRNNELGLREYNRIAQGHSAFFDDLVNAYADSRSAIIQETTLVNFMWKMDGVILPELGHVRAMNVTPKSIAKVIPIKNRKISSL